MSRNRFAGEPHAQIPCPRHVRRRDLVRANRIECVSTTTGFIGAAAYGPVALELDILTSLTELEPRYDPFNAGPN